MFDNSTKELSYETSSLRFKDITRDYNDTTQDFSQLHPVWYRNKGASLEEKEMCGLIAEELDKLYPEYVSYENNEPISINYGKMVVLLIDRVKKLIEKTDQQQAEIERLKSFHS